MAATNVRPIRCNPGRYEAPRRVVPIRGQLLRMSVISGPWRPSGSIAGGGIFAVVWDGRSGPCWAALHDFSEADQRRLVEACRRLDIEAFGSRDP
jgi:hypothetical protein